MSDGHPIQPVSPVSGAGQVQPVRPPEHHRPSAEPRTPDTDPPAATTGGHLRAAYAQFVVDPDTRDVVVRIRDAATDEVLSELPSKEIQAMTRNLKEYAETLARRRAAQPPGPVK